MLSCLRHNSTSERLIGAFGVRRGCFLWPTNFCAHFIKVWRAQLQLATGRRMLAWGRKMRCNLTHFSYLRPRSLRGYSISPDKSQNDIPLTQTAAENYITSFTISTCNPYWIVWNWMRPNYFPIHIWVGGFGLVLKMFPSLVETISRCVLSSSFPGTGAHR